MRIARAIFAVLVVVVIAFGAFAAVDRAAVEAHFFAGGTGLATWAPVDPAVIGLSNTSARYRVEVTGATWTTARRIHVADLSLVGCRIRKIVTGHLPKTTGALRDRTTTTAPP